MEDISLKADGLADKLIDNIMDASLRLLFGPDSAEAGSKMVKGYIDRGVDMRGLGSDEIRNNPEFIELRRGVERRKASAPMTLWMWWVSERPFERKFSRNSRHVCKRTRGLGASSLIPSEKLSRCRLGCKRT